MNKHKFIFHVKLIDCVLVVDLMNNIMFLESGFMLVG